MADQFARRWGFIQCPTGTKSLVAFAVEKTSTVVRFIRSTGALLALAVGSITTSVIAATYGGAAPEPMCFVQQDGNVGGICTPAMTIQGALAATQQVCTNYARTHNYAGTGGAQTYSCYAASTVVSCNLSNPPIPNGYFGGSGATVLFDLVAKDSGTGQIWGTGGWGAACNCPGNSVITQNAHCACPEGMKWSDALQRCVAVQEKNQAQGPTKPCPCFGNPIYPLTGAKKEFIGTGIVIGGSEVTLTYDTTTKLSGGATTSMVELNAFGALWRSNLHHKLQVPPPRRSALLSRGDGTILTFIGNGSNTFSAEGDNPNKLVTIAGGYRFEDVSSGTQETFDSGGKLVSVAKGDGATLTLSYSGENLTKVQANDGRSVRFVYTNDLITKIIGPDWATISVAYDANKNLASLTWPDGKILAFLYEDAALPWALTGRVDENNSRYATYVYETDGRVSSTEHAGGVEKFSTSSSIPARWTVDEYFDSAASIIHRIHSWQAPSGTTVTRSDGQVITLDSQIVNGRPYPTSQSQPAGSGNAASANALAYDSNGNVLSKDDFQGIRTCYAYDEKNRETVRVEGLAASVTCTTVTPTNAVLPTGSRKFSTKWHPDWQMPTEVTEPLRKTTTVYHQQPDPFKANAPANCTPAAVLPNGKPLPLICKTVEEALLGTGAVDTAVPNRVVSHAYDVLGKVLTSVDPSGRTTTQAYYATTSFAGSIFDADIEKVSLLLHGNGANGSNVFTDSSVNASVPALIGAPAVSSAQSKFGGSSMYFGGSADALSYPSSLNVNLASGDFTIEAWFYLNALSTTRTILQKDQSYGTTYPSYLLAITSAGAINTLVGSGNGAGYVQPFYSANGLVTPGVWYHLAFTRQGTALRVFLDGVLVSSATQTGIPIDGGKPLIIGRYPGGGGAADGWMSGYIDDLRITKGVARYTGNFVPPTQELPHSGPSALATGHTLGDLQSITNTAGHTTQFTQYDPAGRLRQTIDPKGVVTDTVYDARGRVVTITVTPPGASARITTFGYDSAGQVTSVSMPDGTMLSYRYDAAHRLERVIDASGNSITYSLDNSGNRIGEEVRDVSGALQRSISRAFDALNRVKQVTGASN